MTEIQTRYFDINLPNPCTIPETDRPLYENPYKEYRASCENFRCVPILTLGDYLLLQEHVHLPLEKYMYLWKQKPSEIHEAEVRAQVEIILQENYRLKKERGEI